MNRDIADHLACPRCNAGLDLSVLDTDGDSVVTGMLNCNQCDSSFRITDSLADLLPGSALPNVG